MNDLIRIGCVDIDTTHPLAFAQCLEGGGRAKYVAVYNDGFRGDDEVQAFINSFGLEKRCDSIEELASMCDVGFVQGCNWDRHLQKAMPFIEAGKPVFIDKPMVGNVAQCRRLRELAAGGAVILGASSMRYAREVEQFDSMDPDKKGEILNIYGTVGVDEFNYAVHIVEVICRLAGGRPLWGKFDHSEQNGTVDTRNYSFGFDNGVTAGYTVTCGVQQPCAVTVMATTGVFQFEIDSSKVYKALLDNICDELSGKGSSLVSVDKLTESIEAMLACKASKDNGSGKVYCRDIPEDCRFDGDEFAKAYAAKAKTIYM